jgi:hypothetical protein
MVAQAADFLTKRAARARSTMDDPGLTRVEVDVD